MSDFLTPVGRIVQGSLYEAQTKDALNNPLVTKTGPQAGTPRVEFYFGLAILKGSESHWNQTAWGKTIWETGQAGFPQGQASSPTFAWKITDGDSVIPNKVGKKPCDKPGFKGCWVLNFSSGFAPTICNHDGTQALTEANFINLGDYIQVSAKVNSNDSTQQPGVYLNHVAVAFAGYGERIVLGVDTKSLGFGGAALPAGASAVPLASNALEKTVAVEPHTQILTGGAAVPPPPPTPVRVMLPAANGVTYEQWVGMGWTDTQLVQHGYLAP